MCVSLKTGWQWILTPKAHQSSLLLSQGYRNFYDRYRGDYDRFYGRDYEYNRYRDYYRQYNRDVSILWGWGRGWPD